MGRRLTLPRAVPRLEGEAPILGKGACAEYSEGGNQTIMRSWKWGSVFGLVAAAVLASGQQESERRARPQPTAAFAVEATGGGALAVWPAGSFARPPFLKWAAAAEAEIASSGEVSARTLQQLPAGGEPGWLVRTGLLQRTAADGSCARGERSCGLRSSGSACDASTKDCACACVVLSGPGQPAAGLWKDRRNGFPFLLVVHGPDELGAALAQLAARSADYFQKIVISDR